MKGIVFALFIVAAPIASASAADDSGYFTITSSEVRELENPPLNRIDDTIGQCAAGNLMPQDLGDLSEIINFGKQIWDFIQAGKPVVDLKTDVGTALPNGRNCWTDLQGWQAPQTKAYEVAFKNAFGMQVVKLSYHVMWMAGGNVNGVGRYIAYGTVFPDDITVMWGFKLNANVSIPVVGNVGTKDQPVAGMQIQIRYQVESVVQTINQGQAYFVDGNGQIKAIN